MSRSVPEWIGKTDDQPVPPRVRLRVLERFGKRCGGCGLSLIAKRWTCDHATALINGGENRESNLQPLGDDCCNKKKNRADVATKSKSYGSRSRHLGARRAKHPIQGWRRFDGTPVRNPKLSQP